MSSAITLTAQNIRNTGNKLACFFKGQVMESCFHLGFHDSPCRPCNPQGVIVYCRYKGKGAANDKYTGFKTRYNIKELLE